MFPLGIYTIIIARKNNKIYIYKDTKSGIISVDLHKTSPADKKTAVLGRYPPFPLFYSVVLLSAVHCRYGGENEAAVSAALLKRVVMSFAGVIGI